MFRFVSKPQPRAWAVPEGRRIYAVGDIHGRLDLLDRLLASIGEDDGARARATEITFSATFRRGPDERGWSSAAQI